MIYKIINVSICFSNLLLEVIVSYVNSLREESRGDEELSAGASSGEAVSVYGGAAGGEGAAATEGRVAECEC